MIDVFVAVGSNIGNRELFLRTAIEKMDSDAGIRVMKVSSIYETEPVGYKEQEKFLNMVAYINTSYDPKGLLKKLQCIENELDRKRDIHWGPRTIDIDILLYGTARVNEPELEIPHPRMLERAFVLIPLRDLGHELVSRYIYNIDRLIEACQDTKGVKLYREFQIARIKDYFCGGGK